MSLSQRIFFGALLGAALVLLFHPFTREMIGRPLFVRGGAQAAFQSEFLLENMAVPPQGSAPEDDAVWLILGAQQLRQPTGLPKAALQSLYQRARRGAKEEPRNAFWPMMGAVLSNRLSLHQESEALWLIASHCTNWDDHQTDQLSKYIGEVQYASESDLAWTYSIALQHRTTDHIVLLRSFASKWIDTLGMSNSHDLEVRAATVRCGDLIRIGARSIAGGRLGIEMEERAVRPTASAENSTRRRLQYRQRFLDLLANSKLTQDRADVEDIYRRADSWLSIVDTGEHHDQKIIDSVMAMWTASVPTALLLSCLAGALLHITGRILVKFPILTWPFTPKTAPYAGVSAGIVTFLVVRLWLPSLWATACFACFMLMPTQVRSAVPDNLEQRDRIPLLFLAIPFAASVVIFFCGLGVPWLCTRVIFDDVWSSVIGSYSMAGIALVLLGLVVFLVPFFALQHKWEPRILVPFAVREFGSMVAVISLVLFIACTPTSAYYDRTLRERLQRLVIHEPNFYLSQ